MRRLVLWAGLLLVLVSVNVMIADKERVVANGDTVLLELAPRDPRSLLQGDYMTLRYALAAEISRALGEGSTDGCVIVRLDGNGVAHYAGIYSDGKFPAPDERRLYFRKRGQSVRLASDAFYFQEGHGRHYSAARYGELRVDAEGNAILVGLRDGELKPLQPPAENDGDT